MNVGARDPGTNDARRPGLMFAQQPRWFVFFVALVALIALTVPLSLRDPEFRAAALFSVNPLTSVKFVVVATVFVLGCIIFIPVTGRVWRSAWSFEFLPDRLIATHQFARRRHEIPWGSIAAVTKLTPSPFLGSSPRQFSCIVIADGTELLFSPLLDRYTEFVDELRGRVTCRVFDPYPELITP